MLYVNHQKTTTYSTAVVPIGSKTFRPDLSPTHELDSLFFIVKNPRQKTWLSMPKQKWLKFFMRNSG